jgi:SAM-dependent methyltransferase
MKGWDASTYGSVMAEVFDTWYGVPDDAEVAAEFLAGLAGSGPALELGIGTGRVALPLAKHGVEVHGIDASAAMVERLRAKPGGQDITVHLGDFTDLAVDGTYQLVYLVYSALYLLLSQEAQRRCLAGVARHLHGDGALVVQALVPNMSNLSRREVLRVGQVDIGHAVIEAARHDPVHQRVDNQQIVITEDGIRLFPVCYRYVWPSELDLMAELAGLRLRDRRGGWQGEPFTATSTWNLSVYEPAGAMAS